MSDSTAKPVHREDEFEHHMSRCGRFTRDMEAGRVTTDWSLVTCKVCLKAGVLTQLVHSAPS